MSEDKGDEKTIRVLNFSGKHEDWDMWSKKFLAMAKRKKYRGVLVGTIKIPKEEGDLTDEGQKKARDANERAYSDLILSCSDDISFGLVDNAVTEDNPSGDASYAWKELVEHYDPDEGVVVAGLKNEFANSKIKTEKPEEWIQGLERIQAKLRKHGTKMEDDEI